MMYSNRFVCSLKVGGKILREDQGVVALPFGSEYNILLKNLNSRRCMVKVSVDGQDATEGTKLIIGPNDSLELERFIKSGNLEKGNRFKFIERTKNIENHRGIKEDDGLIRVEFWAEKEVIDQPIIRKHYYDEWVPVPRPYYPSWPTWYCGNYSHSGGPSLTGAMNSSGIQGSQFTPSGNVAQGLSGNVQQASVHAMNMLRCADPLNDNGITVPGSESNQKFQSSFGFQTESNSHVIVLQLRGETRSGKVSKPVTVDLKIKCPTCGKKQKPFDKFCGECGTAINII